MRSGEPSTAKLRPILSPSIFFMLVWVTVSRMVFSSRTIAASRVSMGAIDKLSNFVNWAKAGEARSMLRIMSEVFLKPGLP